MSNKQTQLCTSAVTVMIVLLLAWVPVAHGVPFFKPLLPDFYQHQKAGPAVNVPMDGMIDFTKAAPRPDDAMNVPPPYRSTVPSYDFNRNPNPALVPPDPGNLWWEEGGGWCCVTAFVNSFYYLEKHFGYDGFFTRAGEPAGINWQREMIFAIEDFADFLFYQAGTSVPKYVRQLEMQSAAKIASQGGAARPRLDYSEFFLFGGDVMRQQADMNGDLQPAVDVSSTFASFFDVYRSELCRGEDVELRLVDPAGTTGAWWSGPIGFHVVTGAGVGDCGDPTNMQIWFADPDKRNMLDATNMYTNTDVREPYPNVNIPLPIGERFYEMATVDATGLITAGLFAGARISRITAISPIPEPSTSLLLAIGVFGLIWYGGAGELSGDRGE